MASKIDRYLGKIHQGDCIKGMAKLPDASVDLVFADPPFNIGYVYDEYDDRLEEQKYIDWCSEWMAQVHRVLSDRGTFWLAIGDEYAAELKVAAKQQGFTTRNWVIWYYTFGVHCKSKFTRSHAHLFYFVKDAKQFTFNFNGVAVPSARQLVYNDKRGNPAGRSPDDTWILRPQDCVDSLTPDEDIWYFPRVAGTFKERAGFHGCQMPEQLLGRIINGCSNTGDIILDPFSGSSTTLAVAKKLGRQFVGFELSKSYATLGTKRTGQVNVGDPLEGAAEPSVATASYWATSSAVTEVKPSIFRSDLEAEASGIVEAASSTHRGFSIDRLVADPILNEDFQKYCDRISLPGAAADRNRFLFRLRKSGRLKSEGVLTSARTELDWDEIDSFIHASEIAWRKVGDLYSATLDDIFCDPRLASNFDEIAKKFAPGRTPLEYRWAALKLRKEVGNRRRSTAEMGRVANELLRKPNQSLRTYSIDQLGESPGVYALKMASDKKKYLYFGETYNLRVRLSGLFQEGGIAAWTNASPEKLQLKFLEIEPRFRLANQVALLERAISKYNLPDRIRVA